MNTDLILVVDDDPTQSLIIKSKLLNVGYDVVVASNGIDAISIFEQQHPALILLDAVMPEINGFETCRRIRALENGEDTLILMLTCLNDDDSVKQAFDAGAVDFIPKPIYWSVLLGRISYLLKAKNAEDKVRKVEERLRQSQKMEAIGNLTNGLSHNFNNILSSIMGYSELMVDTYIHDKSSKPAHYMQEIIKSAKRARDLISQMQVFTSNEVSNPQVIEPSALLNETIKMLRPSVPSTIELNFQCTEKTPLIKLDPVKFQQAILNLLINARDAMNNKGHINIELKKVSFKDEHCASCHHEVNGDFVELSIADTGSGIKKSVLKTIFDPYYTSQPFGMASGMGLSVVHGIIHECGGHILVNSTPNRGSVFKLLFPIGDETLSMPERLITSEDENNLDADAMQHILVVDDEEVIGVYEAEYLQFHGYKATHFSDPRKAIEAVAAKPEEYDLVITDKTMPEIDGLELAGAVMAIRKNLPVIICTGYKKLLPKIDLNCIGIRAQLDKPIDGKKLLGLVKKVLQEN